MKAKNNIFALVDCNNFYASCERVFNPKLEGKPIVVLSNNDGVIIARSNEAKALGIKMATPVFKVRNIIDRNKVHVFSSNYVLYGDLSNRVMDVLRLNSPEIEIYSIDEAFLRLNGMAHLDLQRYGEMLKDKVKSYTGIPISVGIATTKTLTKVANELAKKDFRYDNVLDISKCSDKEIDMHLSRLPIDDVWGIGRRIAPMLRLHGIKTAKDLKYVSDRWIRKCTNVLGLKTVHELRGIACIELEKEKPQAQTIACTRSFGRPVSQLIELKQAVAMYCTRATEKLRKDNQVASALKVFVHTNFHRKDQQQYANSIAVQLEQPTSDVRKIVKQSEKALEKIYKPNYLYKKAGVILLKLMPANVIQLDLFNEYKEDRKSNKLMNAIDKLNERFGRNTCTVAAMGLRRPWRMNQKKKSSRFTTNWDETIYV